MAAVQKHKIDLRIHEDGSQRHGPLAEKLEPLARL